MKTVGFIGAYDKTDLILYIAKLLTVASYKVLIIDASTLQKTKYIVPNISPAKSYVTNYEGIDIAVGFYDYDSIKEYLGIPESAILQYDYIFIDIDSPEDFDGFDIKSADKNFFVTGFDVYSIKRGMEILAGLTEPIQLTKVFFSRNAYKEEEDYFNFISLGYKVIWNEEIVYFPFEQGDQTIIMENQRVSKIKFKRLTKFYKESLLYISQKIVDDQKQDANLKKAFKLLERELK